MTVYSEAVAQETGSENMAIKRFCTRSEFNSKTLLHVQESVCFFCDKPEDAHHPLYSISTLDLVHKNAKECALLPSDERLLAKTFCG